MTAVPVEDITYTNNPLTGKIAFYFAFELEPNKEFVVQVTGDGVTYTDQLRISTMGNTEEVYHSHTVASSAGPWPRVMEL